MEKYFDILKKCSLFDCVDKDSLFVMLKCLNAKVEAFDKKYTVIAEGGAAKYIGIVLSGSVVMTRTDYYGNRSFLARFGQGEIFSEVFACSEIDTVPVCFTADEKSEIMLIGSDHILHTCSNNCTFHKQLIFNLMKNIASKALVFHQKIEIISKRTTRSKLMAYLTMCAKKSKNNVFEIEFDRQELADYLEVDRSGLSAEISKLRSEGVLNCQKNRFELYLT